MIKNNKYEYIKSRVEYFSTNHKDIGITKKKNVFYTNNSKLIVKRKLKQLKIKMIGLSAIFKECKFFKKRKNFNTLLTVIKENKVYKIFIFEKWKFLITDKSGLKKRVCNLKKGKELKLKWKHY